MCVYLDTDVPPADVKNISQADHATRNFGWVRPDTAFGKKNKLLLTHSSGDRNRIGITSQFNTLLPIQYLTKLFSGTAVLSPWSTAAPSPIERSEAGNEVVNNKLYVLGGYVNSSFQATTRSDVYDPATNKWTQLPNLPQQLTHAGVAVDGNTIYLAGGYVGNGDGPSPSTAKVFKYNVLTKKWSQGASLPEPRGAGGLVRLGRELHFFGGHNVNRTEDKGSHWVFNLDHGTSWVSKAPLPNPRNHFGYTVNNGQIYVIGGLHLGRNKFGNQSDVHTYNPLTNAWRKVASLPIPRSHTHTSTFVKNGRIVTIGGRANGSSGPVLAAVTEYNPTLNKWVALSPLPEPRQAAAAKLINNQIIVTTGSASGPNPQTTTWLGGG